MDKIGVSPVVGTVLLIGITVALAAIVAILVSALGGHGPPLTITVWGSFENNFVPEEKSYVNLNDELRIEFRNFSENLPIEYKIVLRHDDGTIENLIDNQIHENLFFENVKCTSLGELYISADDASRTILVISPLSYDLKEIEENALHAQEGATRAEWVAIIFTAINIATSIIFAIYRLKVPKQRKK